MFSRAYPCLGVLSRVLAFLSPRGELAKVSSVLGSRPMVSGTLRIESAENGFFLSELESCEKYIGVLSDLLFRKALW